jgi:hypothetical protein
MHPRYIPTVEQFRGHYTEYDRFLLAHREPSRFSAFMARSVRGDKHARGRLRPPADFR